MPRSPRIFLDEVGIADFLRNRSNSILQEFDRTMIGQFTFKNCTIDEVDKLIAIRTNLILPKTNNPNDADNSRPISILPLIAKVIEKGYSQTIFSLFRLQGLIKNR